MHPSINFDEDNYSRVKPCGDGDERVQVAKLETVHLAYQLLHRISSSSGRGSDDDVSFF